MSIHTFVSPENVNTGRRVLVWAKSYLTREDARLSRPYPPQTVCPYVEASLKSNCFYMVFHNEFDGRNCAAIADQIMDYALPFKAAHPTASNKQMLKALLVVFPNIEPRLFTVLDECHSKIKPKMVELGLMVGQFNPRCREQAIHNRRWSSISKSPVPLMAMRCMSIHDVMFLGDNSQTFRAYDKEFGFQFAEHGKSLSRYQEHLFAYYERARSKHSTSKGR
jgi:hypothetical protein